jgi:hypothetical protein
MAQIIPMPKFGPLIAKELQPVRFALNNQADVARFVNDYNENQRIYIRAFEALKERWKRRGGDPLDEDYEEFYRIWDAQTEDFELYIRYACPRHGLHLEEAVNMLAEDEAYLCSFTARLMEHEEREKRRKKRRQ